MKFTALAAPNGMPVASATTRDGQALAPAAALALPSFAAGSPWRAVLAMAVVFAAAAVVGAVLRSQRRRREAPDAS